MTVSTQTRDEIFNLIQQVTDLEHRVAKRANIRNLGKLRKAYSELRKLCLKRRMELMYQQRNIKFDRGWKAVEHLRPKSK
jgi:hypothetical protein